MEVLILNQIIYRQAITISSVERQVYPTEAKIRIYKSASNELVVQGLETMDEDHSGPTTDIQTKKVNY